MDKILHGDCLRLMKKLPDNSVDLVITSPPYAEQRKSVYGGIPEEKYVKWFLPRGKEIFRVLKPTGSFFLNIKPHVRAGERSFYVWDLVRALKNKTGFHFVEEYCWIKNSFPGAMLGRFKNAFEPVFHFTKARPGKITFNPLACGTPMTSCTVERLGRNRSAGGVPRNGSGLTIVSVHKTKSMLNQKLARPSNVISVKNILNQHTYRMEHPAVFPPGLVEFFVKSFSNEGDLVMDPFAGSGTTGGVCREFKRGFILIDKEKRFVDMMMREFHG